MNLNVYDELFRLYEEYIKEHSNIPITVLKKPNKVNESFPLVIFKEISNTSIGVVSNIINSYSTLGLEFDIYAKRIIHLNEDIDGFEVAKYIAELTNDFIRATAPMQRISNSATPNYDETIDRRTLRYTCKVSDFRGTIC